MLTGSLLQTLKFTKKVRRYKFRKLLHNFCWAGNSFEHKMTNMLDIKSGRNKIFKSHIFNICFEKCDNVKKVRSSVQNRSWFSFKIAATLAMKTRVSKTDQKNVVFVYIFAFFGSLIFKMVRKLLKNEMLNFGEKKPKLNGLPFFSKSWSPPKKAYVINVWPLTNYPSLFLMI